MNSNKNKLKKKIIRVLILLIILLIILFSYLYYIKYVTSEYYVGKILYAGTENVNYSKKDSDMTSYVKKNIEKTVFSDGTIFYDNYNTKESIEISEIQENIVLYGNNGSSSYISKFSKYFGSDDYEYLYEGTEEINGKKYIKVSFTNKIIDYDGTQLKVRFWIDRKTKTYVKIANLVLKDGVETVVDETEYNMTKGDVTEEDISRPDLDSYKDYEIINKSSEN